MKASTSVAQVGLWQEEPERTGREIKELALVLGQPLALKYRGRPVPEQRAADACRLLDLYGMRAHQTVQRFKRDGTPTESLQRVVGALTSYPEVEFGHWVRVIENVLANPWWDGPPSIGVVFGPKIVERNLQDPAHGVRRTTALERQDQAKRERTARRLAIATGRA